MLTAPPPTTLAESACWDDIDGSEVFEFTDDGGPVAASGPGAGSFAASTGLDNIAGSNTDADTFEDDGGPAAAAGARRPSGDSAATSGSFTTVAAAEAQPAAAGAGRPLAGCREAAAAIAGGEGTGSPEAAGSGRARRRRRRHRAKAWGGSK